MKLIYDACSFNLINGISVFSRISDYVPALYVFYKCNCVQHSYIYNSEFLYSYVKSIQSAASNASWCKQDIGWGVEDMVEFLVKYLI